jgi:hypothetical protein
MGKMEEGRRQGAEVVVAQVELGEDRPLLGAECGQLRFERIKTI